MNTSAKTIRSGRQQAGFILSLIAILMLILALAGLATLGLSVQARVRAMKYSRNLCARFAADAGLDKALYEMNRQLQINPALMAGLIQSGPLLDLDGTEAQFQYTIDGNWNTGFSVDSRGVCDSHQHDIHAVLRLKSLFEYALFGNEGMTFKNGTRISAINWTADLPPLLAGTNSIQVGALDMKFGVTIDGDVLIGPGGDPAVVINSKQDCLITGQVTPLPLPLDMSVVPVPASLMTANSLGTIKTAGTLMTSGKYSGIQLGNGDVLKISKPITLWVTGNITLDNSARIEIEEGGSLTLFLGGDLLAKNGGTLNNLTQEAKTLQIYGLETCRSIEFMNSSTLYAAVYAPRADVMSKNSATIVGSIIADSFTQMVAAQFYYDASLREALPTDLGVKLIVSRWWENWSS